MVASGSWAELVCNQNRATSGFSAPSEAATIALCPSAASGELGNQSGHKVEQYAAVDENLDLVARRPQRRARASESRPGWRRVLSPPWLETEMVSTPGVDHATCVVDPRDALEVETACR